MGGQADKWQTDRQTDGWMVRHMNSKLTKWCMNILCTTFEWPQQPFGILLAFKVDLASFIVPQVRHKGHRPCVKGALAQDCGNSSALAMEFPQSCPKPSICKPFYPTSFDLQLKRSTGVPTLIIMYSCRISCGPASRKHSNRRSIPASTSSYNIKVNHCCFWCGLSLPTFWDMTPLAIASTYLWKKEQINKN